MWRDAVKTKLLDERARWLQDRLDGLTSDGDVEIVSVTQLLRVLHGGGSDSRMQEKWGIIKHDISAEGHSTSRSMKRPRAEERSDPAQAGVTAFTSTQLWITGFLRFEPQSQAKRTTSAPRLCLCDATNQIATRLIDPQLELLDALVLIKRWTAVVRWDALSLNATLEIHGEPVMLHPPTAQTISVQGALSALRVQFPTADPPMYVGSTPWGIEVDEKLPRDAQKLKKRKFHVAFGRVTSVSPIAVQDDAANSHFFVEVESYNDGHDREYLRQTTAVVNVLLAGARALQWHRFLWPGLLVMLTNLKKVYYAESEMFLLQAVPSQSSTSGASDASSSLHIWRRSVAHPPLVSNSANSRMMDCEGVVASIIWDECLVLESNPPVTVALFHYPWSDIKAHIRVGARVRVHQAHILYHPHPGHQRIVLGLCPRSHLRVISNAPAHSRLHAPPRQLTDTMHRRRLHKKWSYFGDFSRQPLAVSMWWLQLLENLVQKFRFSSDSNDQLGSDDDLSFPCIRRREATLVIGQAVFAGTVSLSSPANGSLTLARRFLNSHAQDCDDCPSVNLAGSTAYLANGVVTIQALRAHIANLVQEKVTDAVNMGESIAWPVRLEAQEMSSLCVVGVLRGLAESSDLHIADRTASIAIVIEHRSGSSSVPTKRGCGVYALRNCGAIVEQLTTQPQAHNSVATPAHVISLTATVCDLQRVALCSRPHAVGEASGNATRSSVIIFVTDIGPWKRRGRNLSGVTDFRHVRGIGFRTGSTGVNSDPDWSSAHCADVLVSVDCECWFMQRHVWLRLVDAIVQPSASGATTESRLARWFLLMEKYARTRGDDDGMDKKQILYDEEQVQATWAESAKQSILAEAAATYVVDRGSLVCPVAIAQSATKTNGCLVEPNQVVLTNPAILRCVRSLEDVARRANKTHTVQDLFTLQRPSDNLLRSTALAIEVDPHTARLINLVGVVTERTLYSKIQRTHIAAPGEPLCGSESGISSGLKRTRMCRFKIRDPRSLETVVISVDEDAFGTHSALQPGVLVEFAKVQCFLARNSFKPFITWTHSTSARRVDNRFDHYQHLSDAQIIGQMPTTLLDTLYKTQSVDRTIKRVVARLAHVSYVVLKRRCRQCKQPLTLVKRQRMWMHTVDIAEDERNTMTSQHTCLWKQLSLDSPVFNQQTLLSCSMRCIIDDGSAQCELFLENDIVWELLRCSGGQRRRFEELLQRQTSELSYFATRSSADALFTSPSAQENLYYQNEWRAFVEGTVQALSSVLVLAQRFYKSRQSKDSIPHAAVLAFGKDIQITTPRVPLAQLEAIRVDELCARHELRRRLAGLVGHAAKGS